MDVGQKIRILKRYLKEKSISPEDVNLNDQDLTAYVGLDKLLDYISIHNNGLFDFATLESDEKQWKQYVDILNYSATYSPGSPPALINTSERKAQFGLQYWLNTRTIEALPRDNYYTRTVTLSIEEDEEFDKLITESRSKLYAITQTFPEAGSFNPANINQVNNRISSIKEKLDTLTGNSPQITILQKKLNVLTDLNKINQLQRLNIPKDNGSSLSYCTLAVTIEGVTEKISLITLAKVKEQLGHLCAQNELDLDSYSESREQYYKLDTQGILKLPKRGDIKEVQREAMALNISRLMGLDTTSSTTVTYNGHPALFIPFDNINLLNEFSSGKIFKAGMGLSGQSYTHYSTIKPLGEGIQADLYIKDFGNALALLYLCCDTDAIGGYCKNKALRNYISLYIFDQVFTDTDKFILDSRISLQPNQFIMKHTRHGQGRNRTLIEDSSIVTKYASIMQLKELKRIITQYCDHISWLHHNRTQTIKIQLQGELANDERVRLTEELNDVEILEKDAEQIKRQILIRINNIAEVLPQTTGIVGFDVIRQCLILEKLLHNPALYSDDGRPYKNPWTTRQRNTAQTINDLQNGKLQITFKFNIPEEMVDFIKRRGGGDSLTMTSPKVITISKVDLDSLRENMLHPEHSPELSLNTDYLDDKDLCIIKMAYRIGNRTKILNTIAEYRILMNNGKVSSHDKMECLAQTEAKIKALIEMANDKGLGMHILKKFYFDAQQQLQKLINPEVMPHDISQAFAAALKLDRVSEFNKVVREAIVQNKVTDPQFIIFLSDCIKKEVLATNYKEAQKESRALSLEAQRIINHLKSPVVPLIVQLGGQIHSQAGLADTNTVTNLEDELQPDREKPDTVSMTTLNLHGVVTKEEITKNGMTVTV
ncbi:hypothetical protein [Legionella pneumophila]|uniref:Coiled-coil protein n=1 Tax=Legionella pneumophila subsp. pascullei TaxID=91890 RepID=A0AAX2IX93_LEGPN|nr:hypothetical protein [Legionella pneumophila]AMP89439.1 hypothetical protein AXF35_07005 [Legionella pneumophila subsp. pascullei]AMP92895.1 hypothetical protein AXF36_09795 [Legionella pneumophila subsp. pascullei]AMP95861.1 hypothetical protein AXF37_09685 [Legionella pneumophila subsp. pascullei]SQG90779.1 coiled-coil protein [Legionella pneumophila subsp. pascullei]VEH07324.1 coiled-coil protein [Legionella pneumophila subsp. pascullei]